MIKLLGSQNTADVVDKFAAEKFQLTLTERDSTCSITIGPTAPEISVGAWLQDEDDPGAGIVWRVKSVQRDYKTNTRTLQCEHAVMVLKDFLMFGEITPAVITGNDKATVCTAGETFDYILRQQNIWRFGTVMYNDTQAYNFNGDDLYTALETITATIPDAWWEYDFSQVPYVLSIVEKPEWYIGQLSELRMDRNMKSLSVTVDRNRMYTRFYPIGRNNLMLPEKYVGRNENLYGISSQTETDENRTTVEDLRKWANERLDNHAEPQVTVSVNAMDLSAITGEDLDGFVLGAHCTVALPEYGTTIYERITTLQWPDKVRDKTGVTITMANQKEDLTKILSKDKKKTSTGRRSSAASVSRSLKDVTLTGPTDNTYTLNKVLTNGTTEQIGTFSRAVASWVVDVPTGGTIRVTAKPQEQSKEVKVRGNTGSWSGNTYSGLIQYSDDNGSHWFSSGANYTVDATVRYYAGWDNAAAMSDPAPVWSGSGEHTSFSYSYPLKQTDQQGNVTRSKITDTLTMGKGTTPGSSGYATVRRGNALIARIQIGDWYDAGWDAAAALSEAAEAKTGSQATDTFTYKYPVKETIQGVVTRHQVTDTLTVNNSATPAASGYVTVTRGAALLARVNVGNWWTAGWDNASSLSVAAEAKTGAQATDTFTYKYPVTETIEGVLTRHQVTDTLTVNNAATPAASGYVTVTRGAALLARVNVGNWWTAGWDDASSKSEAAAAQTSSTVSNTFTYKYPVTETIEGVLTRHQVTDTLTVNNAATPSSSGFVTVTRGAALIARVDVGNWWTSGWDNASSLSEAAAAKTAETVSNTFTYKYPVTETVSGVLTRHQVTDTLTINNAATPASSGYVTVTRGQALIARVDVGNWYTAGYEAGLPAGIDVSSPPTNAGTTEPANSTKLTGFGQAYIKSHYTGYGWLQFTVTVHGKQKKYHFAFDNR